MYRHFLLIVLLAAATLPGVAVAAETNQTANSTVEQVAETAASDDQQNQTKETIEQQIDPVTRVVSSEYRSGQFHLVLEADVPQLVTLSGSVAVQKGWQTYATKVVRVPPNKRVEVTIAAEKDEGAATVSFATKQCRTAGRCPILSSDHRGGESPLERTTSTAGWLGGAGVAISMFVAAAWQRRNKDWADVEDVN